MKSMQFRLSLLLLALAALTACTKEEAVQTDQLQELGMFRLWKLDTREVGSISSLAIACCDYLEFSPDQEPEDLRGDFKAYGAGYETIGSFELNNARDSIWFYYDDNEQVSGFQMIEDVFIRSYLEDNHPVVEGWRAQN